MTKPHEVDWLVLPAEFGPWRVVSKRGHIMATVGDGCSTRADGADLVAAAPEMARLLLDLEWQGGDVAGNAICPSCCADKYPPGDWNAKPVHRPDCKLDALIERLGLRAP